MESGNSSKSTLSESHELTHEGTVYLKKCRDEAFIYAQVPLSSLLTGIVWYRHRAGYYNHLSFAPVLSRYFFALGSGIVLGTIAYVPFCLSKVTGSDMVDSVLQEQILQRKSSKNLDLNSRLKVPSIDPNEPFHDPYMEAVKPNDGFTTYKQRREFSRQLLRRRLLEKQQQLPQGSTEASGEVSVSDNQRDMSLNL